MASYNRVILMGNLTRDPQVRYTNNQTAVADIGLAVNRVWFDKNTNQKREETTFVDVVLWGRQAEVAGEYLSKGRSVLIEGRLQLDQWDDRETGQKRSKLKVVCDNMQMVGSRSGSGQSGGGQSGGGQPGGGQLGGEQSDGGQYGEGQGQSAADPAQKYYDNAPADSSSGEDVPF